MMKSNDWNEHVKGNVFECRRQQCLTGTSSAETEKKNVNKIEVTWNLQANTSNLIQNGP